MSQISKATQSSKSDTDYIQDIKINSVFVASICSKNETSAKAKRGMKFIQNIKNMILESSFFEKLTTYSWVSQRVYLV